jgi:hypothetical protein
MHLPVIIEGQERSIGSANSDGFAIVHLDEHIGDLLLRAGILRDGVLALGEAVHEAMGDALLESNCQTHAAAPP